MALPGRVLYAVRHSFPFASNGYAVPTHGVARAGAVRVLTPPARCVELEQLTWKENVRPMVAAVLGC